MFLFAGSVCISILASGKQEKSVRMTFGNRTYMTAFTLAVGFKAWKCAQASD